MPFPLNAVFLNRLAELDFLATLTLTNVSGLLHRYILDNVVSASLLTGFLKKNQKALLYDVDRHGSKLGKAATAQEIILLARACTALQRRMDHDELYAAMKDYLAILLYICPFTALVNPDLKDYHTLEEMEVSNETWEQQKKMHKVYLVNLGDMMHKNTIESIKEIYKGAFKSLYTRTHVFSSEEDYLIKSFWKRPRGQPYFSDFLFSPTEHPLLREQLFFCGRYLNELLLAMKDEYPDCEVVPLSRNNLIPYGSYVPYLY